MHKMGWFGALICYALPPYPPLPTLVIGASTALLDAAHHGHDLERIRYH